MNYTLGVDIGTFESKGVLVAAGGRIVAQASRPHRMIVPRPGWAEHRADQDWWGDFVFITKALLAESEAQASDIIAVATSAIGPCMLPVDAAGTPLMNGVLYGVDTRAQAEIELLNGTIGKDVIALHSGMALTSQAVGPKILWLRRTHPDLWAKTAKVMSATSYLTFRLTGEVVIDHHTAAGFAPLYDSVAQRWDCGLSGICDETLLPRILWASDIAGQVTPKAALETGLAPGTPVTCGTIDACAEAVSVGVSAPGDMMMMYGSTIFTVQITADRLTDPRLWHTPWLFPGQFGSMAGLATSGTLTHWFRDQFARDLATDTAFAVLTDEALTSPPGAKGLLCLPYFSGERTPLHDPLAKGAFFGLNLTHSRGDMYRAVLEGIASATRAITNCYAEAGSPPVRVLAVGGGTKNAPWLQATSDLTGLDQSICAVTVGASYGDAYLAALAVGAAASGEIALWNPVDRVVRAERHAVYDRQYPLFQQLYLQTKEIMAALDNAADQ